ncbi:hypothetical protein [Streptosporangium sp. KLBMP 9127]|nr:hypothetical protein [Streptosporangium sp. KLBMP 9127]
MNTTMNTTVRPPSTRGGTESAPVPPNRTLARRRMSATAVRVRREAAGLLAVALFWLLLLPLLLDVR